MYNISEQATFNVSVEFAFGVKVVETSEYLSQDDRDEVLFERTGFHQVQRRTAAQVLHNYPQLRGLHKHPTNQLSSSMQAR